jgi:hypothetical protein
MPKKRVIQKTQSIDNQNRNFASLAISLQTLRFFGCKQTAKIILNSLRNLLQNLQRAVALFRLSVCL